MQVDQISYLLNQLSSSLTNAEVFNQIHAKLNEFENDAEALQKLVLILQSNSVSSDSIIYASSLLRSLIKCNSGKQKLFVQNLIPFLLNYIQTSTSQDIFQINIESLCFAFDSFTIAEAIQKVQQILLEAQQQQLVNQIQLLQLNLYNYVAKRRIQFENRKDIRELFQNFAVKFCNSLVFPCLQQGNSLIQGLSIQSLIFTIQPTGFDGFNSDVVDYLIQLYLSSAQNVQYLILDFFFYVSAAIKRQLLQGKESEYVKQIQSKIPVIIQFVLNSLIETANTHQKAMLIKILRISQYVKGIGQEVPKLQSYLLEQLKLTETPIYSEFQIPFLDSDDESKHQESTQFNGSYFSILSGQYSSVANGGVGQIYPLSDEIFRTLQTFYQNIETDQLMLQVQQSYYILSNSAQLDQPAFYVSVVNFTVLIRTLLLSVSIQKDLQLSILNQFISFVQQQVQMNNIEIQVNLYIWSFDLILQSYQPNIQLYVSLINQFSQILFASQSISRLFVLVNFVKQRTTSLTCLIQISELQVFSQLDFNLVVYYLSALLKLPQDFQLYPDFYAVCRNLCEIFMKINVEELSKQYCSFFKHIRSNEISQNIDQVSDIMSLFGLIFSNQEAEIDQDTFIGISQTNLILLDYCICNFKEENSQIIEQCCDCLGALCCNLNAVEYFSESIDSLLHTYQLLLNFGISQQGKRLYLVVNALFSIADLCSVGQIGIEHLIMIHFQLLSVPTNFCNINCYLVQKLLISNNDFEKLNQLNLLQSFQFQREIDIGFYSQQLLLTIIVIRFTIINPLLFNDQIVFAVIRFSKFMLKQLQYDDSDLKQELFPLYSQLQQLTKHDILSAIDQYLRADDEQLKFELLKQDEQFYKCDYVKLLVQNGIIFSEDCLDDFLFGSNQLEMKQLQNSLMRAGLLSAKLVKVTYDIGQQCMQLTANQMQ